MTLEQKIQVLVAGCKAGVTISFNDHRTIYSSVTDYLSDGLKNFDDVSPELAQEMDRLDTIVEVHFYPRTPVGFYQVHDVSLDKALDKALEALQQEQGPTK